jgi:hypothetical protein
MSRNKLNSIVQKQISASTEFWAGKPKLGIEELSAIESFAKKKGEILDIYCSLDGNKDKLEGLFTASLNK